jgi:hypothetical protein
MRLFCKIPKKFNGKMRKKFLGRLYLAQKHCTEHPAFFCQPPMGL